MSIANVYVKITDGNERYKSFSYRICKSSEAQLICVNCGRDRTGAGWVEMGAKAGKIQGEQRNVEQTPPTEGCPTEKSSKYHMPAFQDFEKNKSCSICSKILYIVLSIVAVIISVALIALAIIVAVAIKMYDTEHSGRAVALIILILSVGATIAVVICGDVMLFKRKKHKSIKASGLVLLVLALVQVVIVALSATPSETDRASTERSLIESFKLSREYNPRHVKIWAATQYSLSCCGVFSPEDYRSPNLPFFFPPDVPITCCPKYDPNRSELVQEREREQCKARNEFYTLGCRNPIEDEFRYTSAMLISLVAILVVIQIILSIFACCMSKVKKEGEVETEETDKDSLEVIPIPKPTA